MTAVKDGRIRMSLGAAVNNCISQQKGEGFGGGGGGGGGDGGVGAGGKPSIWWHRTAGDHSQASGLQPRSGNGYSGVQTVHLFQHANHRRDPSVSLSLSLSLSFSPPAPLVPPEGGLASCIFQQPVAVGR